jgi:hypothetical protein
MSMNTKTYKTEREVKRAMYQALQSGLSIVKLEVVDGEFALTVSEGA